MGWIPTGSGSGPTDLDDLGDVDVSGAAEGDMIYQDDAGDWVLVGGSKTDGKAPMIQADGTVAWETPSGGGGGGATPIGVRQQTSSGDSTNTNSLGLTFPGAMGGGILLLAWAVEGTQTVSSVTQTGATWSQVYADSAGGYNVEFWMDNTGMASSTGVTVATSGANWCHAVAVEVPGITGTFVAGDTVQQPAVASLTAAAFGLAIARAGGSGAAHVGVGISVPILAGDNGAGWWLPLVPDIFTATGGASSVKLVSVATFD